MLSSLLLQPQAPVNQADATINGNHVGPSTRELTGPRGRLVCLPAGLLQVRRHLVDAGLGAGFVLVAARRAGDADRADRVLADLDRQAALRRYDVGEMERAGREIALQRLGEFTGRPALRARR